MAVDPVRRLEIIEAVRITKARYFRHRPEGVGPLPEPLRRGRTSTSPTTWRPGHRSRAASRSAGMLRAQRPPCLAGVVTVHHGHMQEIDVGRTRTSITAMYDRLDADGRVSGSATTRRRMRSTRARRIAA
jgi:hypothetical protein